MRIKFFLRSVLVVAAKNIKIYYNKPPVIIFGILFPFFLFLAFYLGRDLEFYDFFPGLLAMSLFFTASSVGPLITPWEKQLGTYERLLSYPVTLKTIIAGDILAGMVFGIAISLPVSAAGLLFIPYSPNYAVLFTGILLASFCFSSLGVLLASPAVKSPSQIMMFSSLVRFPLIFISGIFIPLARLSGAGRAVAFASPVTYLVDILNLGLTGKNIISFLLSIFVLILFSVIFFFTANLFHSKNHIKGL